MTKLAFNDSADRELETRISCFLGRQYRQTLTNLEIQARNGDVTLRGSVGTFYEKQLAISCCQRVAGVIRVDAAVDVLQA